MVSSQQPAGSSLTHPSGLPQASAPPTLGASTFSLPAPGGVSGGLAPGNCTQAINTASSKLALANFHGTWATQRHLNLSINESVNICEDLLQRP